MGMPCPENQEVLELLTEEDWREIWKRLRYFTYKYYSWLPLKVRGANLDELIQDAIVDTITGRRQWPADVNLVTFLCQVIRSKASHMLEKESKVVSIEDISPSHLSTPAEPSYLIRQEEKEKQAACEQLCERMRELVRGDELLSKIVAMRLDNPDLKPRELAGALGISVTEVHSAQKRLGRRVKVLREEWRNV